MAVVHSANVLSETRTATGFAGFSFLLGCDISYGFGNLRQPDRRAFLKTGIADREQRANLRSPFDCG